MNTEKPNKYEIIYSNSLMFEGRKLAFRKKKLFDLTDNIPTFIPFNEIAQCWIVKRKQLTILHAKRIATTTPISVDISDLQ